MARLDRFRQRISRGHLLSRLGGRVLREIRHALTTLVLSMSRGERGATVVATRNSDEENATVQVARLSLDPSVTRVTLLSPDPELSRQAVRAAANAIGQAEPDNVQYRRLSYRRLLNEYRRASLTYSTHVLLPGRDHSGQRTHVHLTHGSGPKPDTTFGSPISVLASITPQWVDSQLREYRAAPTTRVIDYMPRLEVMRRAQGDRSVLQRLELDPSKRLVVWAPTYRMVHRAGGEIRVSGTPLSDSQFTSVDAALRSADASLESTASEHQAPLTLAALVAAAAKHGWHFVAKPHPYEADSFERLALPTFTNASLRAAGVTPYELFGAADLVITDYSSVYTERARLGLAYALWCPDLSDFASSYRGFRTPLFIDTEEGRILRVRADAEAALS